jgi:hypothetical protein
VSYGEASVSRPTGYQIVLHNTIANEEQDASFSCGRTNFVKDVAMPQYQFPQESMPTNGSFATGSNRQQSRAQRDRAVLQDQAMSARDPVRQARGQLSSVRQTRIYPHLATE